MEPIGVVLAAGKGSRMGPFSKRWPKPVLPVAGEPLVAHQLEAMAAVGVREVVVVIGHLGHEVVRALGDGSRWGVRLDYVEQRSTLGIAHAVLQLQDRLTRPFFLFLGDIFFETQRLDTMLAALESDREVGGVLAVKRESDAAALRRNFTVERDDTGGVTRVMEKPRRPATDCKGCGIYLFAPSFLDAVRRTPKTAMRDEFEITDSIQIFIESGHRVEAAEVIHTDLNLSYACDLLRLNMHVLERNGLTSWIAADVVRHPQARIEQSVVMSGACINAPIAVRRSLVFPGVRLEQGHDLIDTILTPDFEIRCGDHSARS